MCSRIVASRGGKGGIDGGWLSHGAATEEPWKLTDATHASWYAQVMRLYGTCRRSWTRSTMYASSPNVHSCVSTEECLTVCLLPLGKQLSDWLTDAIYSFSFLLFFCWCTVLSTLNSSSCTSDGCSVSEPRPQRCWQSPQIAPSALASALFTMPSVYLVVRTSHSVAAFA